MLTENDVIQAVSLHLKSEGYRIDKVCSTSSERGVDIVATHPKTGKRLLVEAKGATSSKDGTARFGKVFNRGQARAMYPSRKRSDTEPACCELQDLCMFRWENSRSRGERSGATATSGDVAVTPWMLL